MKSFALNSAWPKIPDPGSRSVTLRYALRSPCSLYQTASPQFPNIPSFSALRPIRTTRTYGSYIQAVGLFAARMYGCRKMHPYIRAVNTAHMYGPCVRILRISAFGGLSWRCAVQIDSCIYITFRNPTKYLVLVWNSRVWIYLLAVRRAPENVKIPVDSSPRTDQSTHLLFYARKSLSGVYYVSGIAKSGIEKLNEILTLGALMDGWRNCSHSQQVLINFASRMCAFLYAPCCLKSTGYARLAASSATEQ